ncbi:MAG: tetraacyldisaccharide 4'-kinase [Nitrospira sp.]|nr:tetraacyldisaccharide 4'-kinase [bacterium]MBL7048969.1 tetraacyldisaccharide 4'-kinase [Nitrospira sp.]
MGLLSFLYNIGLQFKKSRITPLRLEVPVISIGNLTLGGTGKTPAAIALAREAQKRGYRPCILTRGYRGKAKDSCIVSRGDGPLLSATDTGDEPFLMASVLKGIPIIKALKRYEAGKLALQKLNPRPDLFILDDGFQHWQLHRDIDVLLIDSANPFGNRRLFPEGIMREPFTAIARAAIIVITKSDMINAQEIAKIKNTINAYTADIPVYHSIHHPALLVSAKGDEHSLKLLKGKRFHAFAGIANPAHFETMLKKHGAIIEHFTHFKDHHMFTQKDIDRIVHEAGDAGILTTEKDMVKLKELSIPDNMMALRIDYSVTGDFYDNLFRRLA